MRRTPIAGLLLGILLGATGCGSTEPPGRPEAAVPVAKWTAAPELPIFAKPDKKKKPIPERLRYRPEKEPTVEQAAMRAMPAWCRALDSYVTATQKDRAIGTDVAASRRQVQRLKALAAQRGLPPAARAAIRDMLRLGQRVVATRGVLSEADRPLYERAMASAPVVLEEAKRACVAEVRVNG